MCLTCCLFCCVLETLTEKLMNGVKVHSLYSINRLNCCNLPQISLVPWKITILLPYKVGETVLDVVFWEMDTYRGSLCEVLYKKQTVCYIVHNIKVTGNYVFFDKWVRVIGLFFTGHWARFVTQNWQPWFTVKLRFTRCLGLHHSCRNNSCPCSCHPNYKSTAGPQAEILPNMFFSLRLYPATMTEEFHLKMDKMPQG